MNNPMQKAHNATRCGAYARTTGQSCKSPAMTNGRCRMHGGRSTGRPKIHGLFSQEAKAEKRRWQDELKRLKELLGQVG